MFSVEGRKRRKRRSGRVPKERIPPPFWKKIP
jgi:hypothetical protein